MLNCLAFPFFSAPPPMAFPFQDHGQQKSPVNSLPHDGRSPGFCPPRPDSAGMVYMYGKFKLFGAPKTLVIDLSGGIRPNASSLSTMWHATNGENNTPLGFRSGCGIVAISKACDIFWRSGCLTYHDPARITLSSQQTNRLKSQQAESHALLALPYTEWWIASSAALWDCMAE